jgi:hypothetical protein
VSSVDPSWLKAIHSSATSEHWSPPEIFEPSRRVLDGFDLDPASSPIANVAIGASRIYQAHEDGKRLPWYGRIWCNPPGLRGVENAGDWWCKAAEEFVEGRATAIVYVLFNLSAVQVAQKAARAKGLPPPQWAARCEPDRRVDYLKADRAEDGTWCSKRGGSPPHPSAILLLSDDVSLIEQWREAHEPLGATMGPGRIPERRRS